ncbi:MAG: TetR/AcrR family transcriptional regulator [Gorillibacterium sp.]|nr:TetR/AcrR family transcriptional regulator [Gorillibacterium sp.]
MQTESKAAAPKLSREETTRRRILTSAKTLFIQNGAEQVNIHQIVKHAGVGQASVYRRYADKSEICLEIVQEECQPLFDDVQAYLAQSNGIPALERLDDLIKKYVTFLTQRTAWLCSIARASYGYRPFQSALYQSMRTNFTALLNEAEQQQFIKAIDIPYTVEILLVAIHNIDFQIIEQGFSTERILAGIRRLFMDGLSS